MNKSKIIALVAVTIILWLVISISLLLAVICAKIVGAPAAIACFVASGLFVIFCCFMCSEEDEDEKK